MKKVLIVDDEDYMRQSFGHIVQKKGFEVFSCATGREAIKLYEEHKPDCVFLDIRLLDMNGREVLVKILGLDPDAQVYFVSGSEDVVSGINAKNLGAKGYLCKPVDLSELLAILKTVA